MLCLAAACAIYRSAGRTTAGYLILSDLTPKNKLIYHFSMRIKQYHQLHIPKHRS